MLLEANFGVVTQCLLLLLAAVIFRLWLSSRDLYIKGSKLPGPPALPFIGNLLQFVTNKHDVTDTLYKCAKEYNGFFKMWLANILLIVITDPEHLQIFYSSTTMLDRAQQYDGIAEVIGHNSIFVSGGEHWKKLRKMFMLTFNPTPTAFLMQNFNDCRDYLMRKLREKADGKIFKAYLVLRVTTTQAILKNTLGIEESEEKLEWVMEQAQYLAKIAYIRQFAVLMRFDLTFKRTAEGKKYFKAAADVQKWVEDLVLDRIEEYKRLKENGEPIPKIYIYGMLEKYGDFPLIELRNEMMNVIITGLDTLGGTTGFVLLMLALYPELQEQVYQEDQEIQKAAAGRDLDLDDLQKYELLERVIKETLRIFPVGPIIGRKLPEDTYFGKHLVPKGANIGVLALYTYRNPAIFPDPLKFNADRFLPENVEKRHLFSFNPFSAGPRACPGMRYAMMAMKTYLPAIFREFKIGCQYSSLDEALNNIVAEVTLTDINHYPITLTPRS